MTPLADILSRQIAATGPMSVADYMATCLMHPRHGYYATRQPLGATGDFVTAPEISQMFGELVGLALAQAWRDRGAPGEMALVELGPGRGTLMADALRATRGVPGFHAAVRPYLVEGSPVLRDIQAQTLAAHEPIFVDRVEDLPEIPALMVANELFDALPIRQFLRDGDLWRERLVGLAEDRLAFAFSDAAPLVALRHRLADTTPGDMVETCAPATALAATLGAHIEHHGGAALIVDYGGPAATGDSFQAVRRHTKESPLAHPGEADLTAHVDFDALVSEATCGVSALTPQGVWLERLGITPRARTLARNMSGAALDTHVAAHRRLTHPDEMGHLFKVLCLHDAVGPLPGLDPGRS